MGEFYKRMGKYPGKNLFKSKFEKRGEIYSDAKTHRKELINLAKWWVGIFECENTEINYRHIFNNAIEVFDSNIEDAIKHFDVKKVHTKNLSAEFYFALVRTVEYFLTHPILKKEEKFIKTICDYYSNEVSNIKKSPSIYYEDDDDALLHLCWN